MKTTGVIRKLDELGRITLPIELRRSLNLDVKDALEITVQDDCIILKKAANTDIFTGGTEDLVEYEGKKVSKASILALAKLAGGVAVIKVGAATEVEMKDKKLRIEDALNATKAAVQEGVVAGGGTAPINAIPAVRELCDTLEGDERTGAKIVLKALEAPLRQIAKNAVAGSETNIIGKDERISL